MSEGPRVIRLLAEGMNGETDCYRLRDLSQRQGDIAVRMIVPASRDAVIPQGAVAVVLADGSRRVIPRHRVISWDIE